MEKFFEMSKTSEVPKSAPTEREDKEKMEQEITPEYVEAVSREIKKEGSILKLGMDKFPKLKKAVAAGMLLTTIWGAGLVGKAEAGDRSSYMDRSAERSAASAIDKIAKDVAKGLGSNLGNIFERWGSGLTPREQARAVERQMRLEEQRARQDQRAKEQAMRELERETRRYQENYEKQKRDALEDYRRELSRAKTPDEIALAGEKYKLVQEALDKSYGIKKSETKESSRNQPVQENATQNVQKIEEKEASTTGNQNVQEKPKWNIQNVEYYDERLGK